MITGKRVSPGKRKRKRVSPADSETGQKRVETETETGQSRRFAYFLQKRVSPADSHISCTLCGALLVAFQIGGGDFIGRNQLVVPL